MAEPDPSWDTDAQWDHDAERVYGIRRWSLREGLVPQAVMTELNACVLSWGTVWCDGWHCSYL
tara:strand:+ start:4590 stop:4778 length:189 start_codon:yes stop_codon:yes gene_type:complete